MASSEEVKLDPAMMRKFDIRLKTFNLDFVYHDATLRQTTVGISVADDNVPEVLIDEHAVAPDYVASASIAQLQSKLPDDPTYMELSNFEALRNQDRDRQLKAWEKLRGSHRKIALELEHIHRALFNGTEKAIHKIIISIHGHEVYKREFITNRRNPYVVWRWIKHASTKGIRNTIAGLDKDWRSITLRHDIVQWWLDIGRVLQAYEDIQRPLDDDRKVYKAYTSLTKISIDESCTHTSIEIVAAFQTLLLPYDLDDITWDIMVDMIQNQVAILNKQREVRNTGSILYDNPVTNKYNKEVAVNVKNQSILDERRSRSPQPRRHPYPSSGHPGSQKSRSPHRPILKDKSRYGSGSDRSRENSRSPSRDHYSSRDNSRDNTPQRRREYENSSRESSRERSYRDQRSNNGSYNGGKYDENDRSRSLERKRQETHRPKSPNNWRDNKSPRDKSPHPGSKIRFTPSSHSYRPPHHQSNYNKKYQSSSPKYNNSPRGNVSVNNINTTIDDSIMNEPASSGISTDALAGWNTRYENLLKEEEDENGDDCAVSEEYNEDEEGELSVQIRQVTTGTRAGDYRVNFASTNGSESDEEFDNYSSQPGYIKVSQPIIPIITEYTTYTLTEEELYALQSRMKTSSVKDALSGAHGSASTSKASEGSSNGSDDGHSHDDRHKEQWNNMIRNGSNNGGYDNGDDDDPDISSRVDSIPFKYPAVKRRDVYPKFSPDSSYQAANVSSSGEENIVHFLKRKWRNQNKQSSENVTSATISPTPDNSDTDEVLPTQAVVSCITNDVSISVSTTPINEGPLPKASRLSPILRQRQVASLSTLIESLSHSDQLSKNDNQVVTPHITQLQIIVLTKLTTTINVSIRNNE